VLLAARADRLTRMTADLYRRMDLSARQGWCSRTADGVVDTCSESGQLMAKVAGLFAEQERRLISARTSAALQAKKAQGHCPRASGDDRCRHAQAEQGAPTR